VRSQRSLSDVAKVELGAVSTQNKNQLMMSLFFDGLLNGHFLPPGYRRLCWRPVLANQAKLSDVMNA